MPRGEADGHCPAVQVRKLRHTGSQAVREGQHPRSSQLLHGLPGANPDLCHPKPAHATPPEAPPLTFSTSALGDQARGVTKAPASSSPRPVSCSVTPSPEHTTTSDLSVYKHPPLPLCLLPPSGGHRSLLQEALLTPLSGNTPAPGLPNTPVCAWRNTLCATAASSTPTLPLQPGAPAVLPPSSSSPDSPSGDRGWGLSITCSTSKQEAQRRPQPSSKQTHFW